LNNLITYEVELNNTGSTLAYIKKISTMNPKYYQSDIGADDLTPLQTDAGIYSIINPEIPLIKGYRKLWSQ
jgi:hypothetical protein